MVMGTSQFRLVHKQMPPAWGGMKYTGVEIFHLGKWKCLSRTDLWDDVGTTSAQTKTLDEWIAHYLRKLDLNLGARYDDTCFSIIDRISDG